jgi:hypothetical protein
MTKYNPMKNDFIRRQRAYQEQRRRGETGLLTKSEKKFTIANADKCGRCRITYPLTVHHKDGNRFNNEPENLMVVCFNCHYVIEHGDAKYSANKGRR